MNCIVGLLIVRASLKSTGTRKVEIHGGPGGKWKQPINKKHKLPIKIKRNRQKRNDVTKPDHTFWNMIGCDFKQWTDYLDGTTVIKFELSVLFLVNFFLTADQCFLEFCLLSSIASLLSSLISIFLIFVRIKKLICGTYVQLFFFK